MKGFLTERQSRIVTNLYLRELKFLYHFEPGRENEVLSIANDWLEMQIAFNEDGDIAQSLVLAYMNEQGPNWGSSDFTVDKLLFYLAGIGMSEAISITRQRKIEKVY